MATAPAVVTTKQQETESLRTTIRTSSEELRQLRQKLAVASSALATLQEKRHQFAEAAADGKPESSVKVAALHNSIAEAELPVGIMQQRVTQKEGEIERTRAELETLNRAISVEAQQAARRARFDALAKQGREITAQISAGLRALLETDLPALETVRETLTREFAGNPGEFSVGARELIAGFHQQLQDGPFLRHERKLLREGWTACGLELTLRTLRPPR